MYSPVSPHKNSVTLIILTSYFSLNNVCLQCTVKAETDVCSTDIFTVLDRNRPLTTSEDPQCTLKASPSYTSHMSLKDFELKKNSIVAKFEI